MKPSSSFPHKRMGSCNSSASSLQSLSLGRRCDCGKEVVLLTSKTHDNPGRLFWRCRNWAARDTCNYFQWVDEEDPDYGVNVGAIHRMEQEMEELKRKNVKLQKKLTTERVKGNLKCCLLVVSWVLGFTVCLFFCFEM
ncbi:Zinc finger, GRF-type [Sesbania bispinosa]|nr:Zinc finger, GRF-type [Sesbania bispinosa]